MEASRSGPLMGDLKIRTPCGGLKAEALGGDKAEAPCRGASRTRPFVSRRGRGLAQRPRGALRPIPCMGASRSRPRKRTLRPRPRGDSRPRLSMGGPLGRGPTWGRRDQGLTRRPRRASRPRPHVVTSRLRPLRAIDVVL